MNTKQNLQISYTITGIGQDSHAFATDCNKPLKLGGITITDHLGLNGNSDADVVLHALCNAMSSISGVRILGKVADKLCSQGIIDSKVYVKQALTTLQPHTLVHIAISIECKQPRLDKHIDSMRQSIADICKLAISQVGITATSGEGLTDFGLGKGIQAFVSITVGIDS